MQRFSIVPATEGDRWQQVVDSAWLHDFYHRADYHLLAERSGEGRARLFVAREGADFVALPLLLREIDLPGEGPPRHDATSVYGYAGPIASRPDPPSSLLALWRRTLAEELVRRRVVTVFSRLHPLLPQTPWLAGLGECAAAGATVSIDLTPPDEERRRAYRQNHRRDLRRLERDGVTCEPDPEWRSRPAFEGLYAATMKRLGAASSYRFSPDYFEALSDCAGAELFVCRAEGAVVCAGVFLLCGPLIGYHLSGTAREYVGRAPLKLLLDGVAGWGRARGAQTLHLGGGVGSRDDALMHFKRGFSDRTHPFNVWRWVVDPAAYEELTRDGGESSFFPAYRRAHTGREG